ncbi:S8 family serine peptidase [Dehalobacterium formicoaceticum]|uniref:S8 family serine peptidase n=1 Tax=Dehalobacterium formicoaceticum TaxID=51515 RepID=A0ABT1Y747_9FIRM|nr:S8 family serine peptidase [Dehalobacterium formicoaceticum]MCR6545724.1 S8 family serine peptidase [Dehalobacterium formicoaceticum]
MFCKKPSSALLMLVILGGIIFGFTDVSYAQADDNNPFIVVDQAREEMLKSAKEKISDQDLLKKSQSLKGQKKEKGDRKELSAETGKRYLVKFKEEIAMQEIFDIVNLYPYELLGMSEQRTFMIILEDLPDFEQRTSGIIEFIEADQVKKTSVIPSDTYYPNQWALPAINMPQAWDINKGSNSVYVAVIDTGVYRDHPDLVNADIRAGWDYYFDDFCYWDDDGHGTNVTGIIGAKTNNYLGIAGLNWDVAIVPLNVDSGGGITYTSDEIEAIYDATEIECDVINLSLGGSESSLAERNAVSYAISHGTIVVAAAGNDGTFAYDYPASYDGVISVGSVNRNLTRSVFSQYNNKIDVTAPGEDIYTTAFGLFADGQDYIYTDGTSFSAPYVSGVAALAVACKPSITVAEFEAALKATCTDLGSKGFDKYYGYGLINAEKLLQNFAAPTLQSIKITKPALKLVYTVGEPLDITGLEVTGTYSDSSKKVEQITSGNITGFDSSYPAVNQTLTITVGGKTVTFSVNIEKKVEAPTSGDVDGNGKVDILDVVLTINFVLEKSTYTQAEFDMADLNKDGALNIFDVMQMINIVLEKQ